MTFLPIEVMLTAGIVLLALALVILSAIATRRKAVSKIKETSAVLGIWRTKPCAKSINISALKAMSNTTNA